MRSFPLLPVLLLAHAIHAQSSDYFPLQIGSRWTYSTNLAGPMVVTVDRREKVGDADCAVLVTLFNGKKMNEEWLAAQDDAVRFYRTLTPQGPMTFGKPVVRLQLPVKDGDRWTSSTNLDANKVVKGAYRVQAPVTVTIHGKEITAVKVTATLTSPDGEVEAVCWYQDGVGMVKQTYAAGGKEIVAELEKFEPANAQPQPAPVSASDGKCERCGATIAKGAKFCGECGAPAPQPKAPESCPKCGSKLAPGAKFCPECGARIIAPAHSDDTADEARAPVRRTPIAGGSTKQFHGVSFDLPRSWSMQENDEATLLVPHGANPSGKLEEAYMLIADAEHPTIDGADVDRRVATAVQQLQPGVERRGAVQKVAFGGLDGRLYVFGGADANGRELEVRVHGFLGRGAACALVSLGYADVLAKRSKELQAILGSLGAPVAGARAAVASELAGAWVYLANFNATNGGGSMTQTVLTLNSDGRFTFHAQSSSSNPFGSVAGETRDSGSWSATADTLTLVGADGKERVYALVKRNHPKNKQDPMIVLDGRAFVTAGPRAPWR